MIRLGGRFDMTAEFTDLQDDSIVLRLRRNQEADWLHQIADSDEITFKQRPQGFVKALREACISPIDTEPIIFWIDGTSWEGEVIYFTESTISPARFSLRLVNGPPYGLAAMLRTSGVFVVKFNDQERLNLIDLLSTLPE